MKKEFRYKYILILIAVLVILFVYYIFASSARNDSIVIIPVNEVGQEKTSGKYENIIEKSEEKKVLSEIILEIGNNKTNLPFEEGETLYQILEKAKNDNKIILEGKNDPTFGFFVTQIGELKEGDGKYLFYNINNKEGEVGVSSYKPQNGDIVSWELK